MTQMPTATLTEDDEGEAETRALATTIDMSDADPRVASHAEVRAWLLRLAEGEFDAPFSRGTLILAEIVFCCLARSGLGRLPHLGRHPDLL